MKSILLPTSLILALFLVSQGLICSLALQKGAMTTTRRNLFWVGWCGASSATLASPSESQRALALTTPEQQLLVPGAPAVFNPTSVGDWDDFPTPLTKLGQNRLLARELSPLQQSLLGPQELYYAPFLFGSWNVTATLKRKIYPFGTSFWPSTSLLEGSPRYREEQVGNVCNYTVHYFSSLEKNMFNNNSPGTTVSIGDKAKDSRIIQDRSFNAISISNAYKQLTPVQEVDWDYRTDPTKVSLSFGTGLLTADMRPLGPRRAQIFFSARTTDAVGEDVYCTAERSRSVTLATRAAIVSDTETITEFHRKSTNHVTAFSRIAVYLSPNPNSREGILWQQTGGKAVAFFEYQIDMNRQLTTSLGNGQLQQQRACVPAPNGVVQCDADTGRAVVQ